MAEENRKPENPSPVEVKLFVRRDLARAFYRCTWLAQQETGRSRLQLMEELVVDFLRKHGC
ncbi:MAG: hypothetical protein CSA34_00235 [Desulfobulbus propionicus]|nr:MAG: hypothetical protein CSA34_00235 [Desulfobulbus propionicus]